VGPYVSCTHHQSKRRKAITALCCALLSCTVTVLFCNDTVLYTTVLSCYSSPPKEGRTCSVEAVEEAEEVVGHKVKSRSHHPNVLMKRLRCVSQGIPGVIQSVVYCGSSVVASQVRVAEPPAESYGGGRASPHTMV